LLRPTPKATNPSRDAEEEVDKAVEVVDVVAVDLEEVLVEASEVVATVKAVAMVKDVVVVAAAELPSLRHRSLSSL
jgi:hypothetical protein